MNIITRAVDYAVRMLIYLGKKGYGNLVTKKEVSEICNIPPLYLAKIAQTLSKNSIINIAKGSKGGYILIREPEDISLLEIIESMNGKIYLNQCIKDQTICKFSDSCYVHKIWVNLTEEIRRKLNKITLKDLCINDTCFNKSNNFKEVES